MLMEFKGPPVDIATVRKAIDIFEALEEKYELLDQGVTRAGFLVDGDVIKVPVGDEVEYLYKYGSRRNYTRLCRLIALGNYHNWQELDFYTDNPSDFELAEIKDYNVINGVHISRMEYLDRAMHWGDYFPHPDSVDENGDYYEDKDVHLSQEGLVLPKWVRYAPDLGQGGFDKDGVFKIYDYSDIRGRTA